MLLLLLASSTHSLVAFRTTSYTSHSECLAFCKCLCLPLIGVMIILPANIANRHRWATGFAIFMMKSVSILRIRVIFGSRITLKLSTSFRLSIIIESMIRWSIIIESMIRWSIIVIPFEIMGSSFLLILTTPLRLSIISIPSRWIILVITVSIVASIIILLVLFSSSIVTIPAVAPIIVPSIIVPPKIISPTINPSIMIWQISIIISQTIILLRPVSQPIAVLLKVVFGANLSNFIEQLVLTLLDKMRLGMANRAMSTQTALHRRMPRIETCSALHSLLESLRPVQYHHIHTVIVLGSVHC